MMKKSNSLHPATIAARANGVIDYASGGVVPPIQLSTTFARDHNNQLLNTANLYGRDHSDIVRIAQDILCELEHADETLLFPSGMAAIAAVMRSGRNGGSIILQSGIYWGTTKWVREFCQRREIALYELDCSISTDLDRMINEKKPDIVFMETPSNPWLKIVDVARAAKTCKSSNSLLVVDATAATPVLSRPLDMGAHIVMHSATKAINGHSDVLAGVLSVANKATPQWQMIKSDRKEAGAVIGNFEAWLLVRGLRTLPLRIERMCENAMAVAKFLSVHDKVEQVLFPGLTTHAGHQLAKTQMPGGFGFLMSVLVRGNRDETLKACGALNLIHRATSLGGVESLVEHRQTIEPDLPENLLRFSIGIENIHDLLGDLDQALSVIK